VRTLALGGLAAGSHALVWDGRDELGQERGSGVYWVRVVAGDATAIRKILRVR
jgi:flagellar hook assembly protein FlgD